MPVGFIVLLLDFYSLVLFASVILSWLNLGEEHPLVRFIGSATEPVLAPIRRVLPAMGGLDLSPMVLFFAIRLLKRVLVA
jgi:YggT family protein